MKSKLQRLAPASALVLTLAAGPALATTVTPVLVPGNPTCADLGLGSFSFKIDPPAVGTNTYSLDGINDVTVTIDGTPLIDWSATIGMDAVIVKGGPVANVYVYNPEATSDTGLTTPTNPNNDQPYGLSHLDFCFDYEVGVTKDAHTTFTRTYQWSIDKSVSPALWNLFTGDSGTSHYTIAVARTGFSDSDWAVSGTIHIHNPAPFAATIESVSDTISPDIGVTPDCGVTFPYTLASNATLDCTYSSPLPDGTSRTNTATVATSGQVGPGSGTAAVTFGVPTTEVNASVNVTDSNGGAWGPFGAGGGSVGYDRTFACNGDQGTHNNTATITETGQTSSAAVSVACAALQVTKDAHTSLDRSWTWTIAKVADQSVLTLASGEQFPVNYQVTLNATSTDSDWAAQGTISITNPSSHAAVLNGVADAMDFGMAGPVAVNCGVGFPYVLAGGGTLQCSYVGNLTSAATRTNTATATLQNFAYAADGTPTAGGTTDFTGSATVSFSGAAVQQFDECADASDSLQGALGTVCWNQLPKTFSYQRSIGPYTAPGGCGDHNVVNTASFVTGDNGHTGEASWTVVVHVPCQLGCTLTQGYWKTHSQRGPAPYDATWALLPGGLQQDSVFFLSGKTYYQVMWTPPAGNAYYILADQYIAAVLNVLKGTSAPPEVISALNEATGDFQLYTPAYVGSLKAGSPLRKRMLELAGLLDMYNNGLIGPGHCSE